MILSGKKIHIAAIPVLFLCMLANCWHTHLWGPDEPREAEIAREIFQGNHWIVPRFNGYPFVEKPPLYYDASALIYSISQHPGALRLHSALLGCLLLAALYLFAAEKCGKSVAFFACALCISMPQFYRAAHWILLDIAVGAWITAGIVCYGLWSLNDKKENSKGLAILFFLFAASAMLTKGIIALVYLGIIILPHWFFFRRKKLPPVWTVLFFLIPVGIWLWLFYREGGIYFLHEHFVNNIIGRLLHRSFHLEGSPIIISDVGNRAPLYFYFKRMPFMFGAVIAVLPFSLVWGWRTLGWKSFHWKLPEKLQRIWDLFTKPYNTAPERKDLLCYLMLWSFVPILIFSIPAIKEVSYLLPSYAGIALFVICYVFDRLRWKDGNESFWVRSFILPLLCFMLASRVPAGYSLVLFCVCVGLIHIWLVWEMIHIIMHRDYQKILLPVLATLIGCVLVGNTPELMVRLRLSRKCYCQLAEKVWENVGACRLYYLKIREESIRGAVPFYGNRDIYILHDVETFYDLFAKAENHAFLLYEAQYDSVLKDPEFRQNLPKYRVFFPGFPEKADTFVVLIPKQGKTKKQ